MDTRTFYNGISGAYDLIADAGEGACRAQGLQALAVVAGEDVLELGFGTGHALESLAVSVGPNGMVCGVDISEGMLEIARRRVQAAGIRNVALTIGDARALSFRDASFDAVFMSFTLELFDSAAIPVVLAEVRRVLRRNGRVGVVAMTETADQSVITDIYTWLHRHFPHFVDCRPIDVAGLLERAGFRVRSRMQMSICGLPVASCVGMRSGAPERNRPSQAR